MVESHPSNVRRTVSVAVEAAAVVAIALVPLGRIPAAVPLFAVASCSLWLRHRAWAERFAGGHGRIGALAGLVALAIAVLAGTPLLEALGEPVVWSAWPIVRGSGSQAFAVAVIVIALAIAQELALRGWIVERVLELGGSKLVAVFCGGLAEALVAPEGRIGAGLFGVGLGILYIGSGRSLTAPLAARIAFALGALVLEALRLVT